MTDIIQLLPDAIANQIAAGEVVQRPASAVKELLENAIDAKATSIQLVVKDAGKTLVQVIDNGIGMSETDARMCFERHATSKIRTSDDLFAIKTMGFRGEAMASIAAVAQVEMRSRRASDELGVLLKIEGSELKLHEATQCPVGTNVQMKNLFFNVPARRNFLKSNPVEFKHILDEFLRVALAHPTVAFSLFHNNEELYKFAAGNLHRRILDVFGRNHEKQLVPCQDETELLKVKGYIGLPQHAKKTKNEQYFFVNNRFIKSPYLHHAIMAAYEGLLEAGSYPFYVLFLEIDPKHIDINVHPTKTEIKFDDERVMYAILNAMARKAISSFNLTHSLDFDGESNASYFRPSNGAAPTETFSSAANTTNAGQNFKMPALQKANLGNWEKLYEGFEKTESGFSAERFTSKASFTPEPQNTQSVPDSAPNLGLVSSAEVYQTIQIHNKYICTQVRSGLMVIDQKRAYERILFDQYAKAVEVKKHMASQTLLFPESIDFAVTDAPLIAELRPELEQLGFMLESLGGPSFMINAVPVDLGTEPVKATLEKIVEDWKHSENALQSNKAEAVARSLASKTAQGKTVKLNSEQMHAFVDQLFSSTNPQTSPSGQPIMRIVNLEELAGLLV
jgi:DNA mismatch repair protein MutL